jgi:hypothetical protein
MSVVRRRGVQQTMFNTKLILATSSSKRPHDKFLTPDLMEQKQIDLPSCELGCAYLPFVFGGVKISNLDSRQ